MIIKSIKKTSIKSLKTKKITKLKILYDLVL